MLLDSICNSKVYHQNAYYLLGLQVGMSGRKLKRRIEDLEVAENMGGNDWSRAYDKFLLGLATPPGKEVFEDLVDRIKNPEFAITNVFFWFWPTNDANDPAIESIASGNRESAFNIWRSLATKSTAESVIAKHNLAVLFHYYAIDAENQRLAKGTNTDTKIYLDIVDGYWRTAFAYWEDIVDDDDFWDAFFDRVKAMNEPSLGDDFVSNFRRQFPISFDSINADFMVAYARAGRLDDAKRHFAYMCETMSDSDDVDETLNAAFKPQIDRLNIQIKHCRESKVDADGLKDIQSVLNASKELFGIFSVLLPPENRMYKDLKNDIAKACHDRMFPYVKKTQDFEGALMVEKDILKIAVLTSLQNSIKESINQLEKIIKDRRDADTCWYCKTYRKGMTKKTVKMYGNVLPNPDRVMQRGVTFSTRQVQVPVCSNCSYKFSVSSAKTYPLIQQSLADGWKIGEGPSNAEIDAVWNDIIRLFENLGRRGY